MNLYVITFRHLKSGNISLAKLTGEGYGDAHEKATRVMKRINERLKEHNQEFELVKITPLSSIEDWDDD